MGDLHTRRALPPFIFISVHHLNHFFDHTFLKSHLCNIFKPLVLLDISLENRIKDRVGGKGILILLVWPQFRRRWFNEYTFGDDVLSLLFYF